MELNTVEMALKQIYDDWALGNRCENNGYSAMFRMGFPEEYMDSQKPLLMYVGQECLKCTSDKTQAWVRNYQNVQRTKIRNGETVNKSAFWNFYRRLCDAGYDVVWNNLDKFHPLNEKRLSKKDGINFNQPYGKENLSVLQREVSLLNPKVIVLAIGKDKYMASLASAFAINKEALRKYAPSHSCLVNDISDLLGLEDVTVLWTYHPNHLQLSGNYRKALDEIMQRIDTTK